MRISDWSSDVCSSDLTANIGIHHVHHLASRIPYYRLPRVLRDHPELAGTSRLTFLQSLGCIRLALWRSEEHTSELKSLMRTSYAVFCLKKKKIHYNTHDTNKHCSSTRTHTCLHIRIHLIYLDLFTIPAQPSYMINKS